VSLVGALAAGNLTLSASDLLASITDASETAQTAQDVVIGLRLPRALAAFACGGLLALAGALMQVLLRNPLADPYVLGISGGAGVGALSAMLLGTAEFGVPGLAFVGALTVMLLVFGLTRSDNGGGGAAWQTPLLLTGVVVASGCGALVALILTLAPEQQLHGMLFWLMGDLSQAVHPLPALGALCVALAVALPFAGELNLLARGAEQALALGVTVPVLRRIIYVIASLATAAAVTTAGSIGFIGLIVPHLVRRVIGNDQRLLLPAAVLAGGSLLTLADTAARTIAAPVQLPVGVLTALIGVPVFLYLLRRNRP
jgi:iron complex transport system permease protein